MNIPNLNHALVVAELLLDINAISFKFDAPFFTFSSGIKSPIYIDNRLVISFPSIRERLVNIYINEIDKYVGISNTEWVSATASAAIPMGAWIAHKLNLPLVYFRPMKKNHGRNQKIEGFLEPGKKVIIVEDHISTARSAIENAQAVRTAGGQVEYCISTSTYETQDAANNLDGNNLRLISLTTGRVIVEVAYKTNRISKAERKMVEQWLQDPQGWNG
jgi:orotate phosphoribosyltransferase